MNFRFEAPWLLLLLVLPILLAVWPFITKKRTQPASLRYADISLVISSIRTWRIYARHGLTVLRLLAMALVIVAVARPQFIQARQVVKGEGVDIVLALDISGSMASLDFQPKNRLEAAKQVIQDFIKERPYDRVGLVVFARNAFSQSPPTIDHAVLLRLLNQVKLSTDLHIDDGTAIGMGLANASNMLKDSKAKSKVVILLTDGVNNSGEIDPLTAAEAAKTLNLKIYTIGAAKTGEVPVPGPPDLFGNATIVYRQSEIDEKSLQQIADTTGALYFRAEDTAGLKKIYEEINRLEKSQIEVQTYTRYQELVIWLLVPAMLLFLLEMLLSQTVLRKIP